MKFRQIQLGRLFGIPLIIDYSWPPVVILHIWLLSTLWLPTRIWPAWPFVENVFVAMIITALFFGSVIFHELAHSLIARLEGIRIKDIQLHIFGGWARLIGEPKTAMAEFRVAIAGPASSFLLGTLFISGLLGLKQLGSHSWPAVAAIETCYYLAAANIFLAMFNLLPGLPLDGGRALRALLWQRRRDILSATRTTKKMGVGIAYMLISYSLFLLAYSLFRGRFWQDFLFAVWLFVIGLFLKKAAEMDLRVRERQQEQGLRQDVVANQWDVDGTVGAVMRRPAIGVPPEMIIDDFIEQILSRHRHTTFPVAREGRLHGILSLARLREIARERWGNLQVREVMEPINDDSFVTVRASLAHARHKMRSNQLGFLAVIDPEGFLVGYLEKADLAGGD